MIKRTVPGLLILVALLSMGAPALASTPVLVGQDATITVDVPVFGWAVPSGSGAWNLTLASDDATPGDGFDFKATNASDYSILVYSNASVVISLDDGQITAGAVVHNPVYTWTVVGSGVLSTNRYTAEAPGTPVPLYASGAPVQAAQIRLTDLSLHVDDITTLPAGEATGTLVVTVTAAP